MSNLSTEVTEQIFELREEGYSIREIADTVDVPKSTVGRALKDASQAGVAGTFIPHRESGHPVIHGLEMERSYERKSFQPGMSKEEVRLWEKELELRERELSVQESHTKVVSKLSDQAKEEKAQRLEGRKQVLVDKFNRLLKEFTDNCQNSTWDGEEVRDFIERGDILVHKVERVCSVQHTDEESLAIWNYLDQLIEFMEDQLEAQGKGFFNKDIIELDLSDRDRDKFEGRQVEDFDEEYIEEDVDDLDAENEEDEDSNYDEEWDSRRR